MRNHDPGRWPTAPARWAVTLLTATTQSHAAINAASPSMSFMLSTSSRCSMRIPSSRSSASRSARVSPYCRSTKRHPGSRSKVSISRRVVLLDFPEIARLFHVNPMSALPSAASLARGTLRAGLIGDQISALTPREVAPVGPEETAQAAHRDLCTDLAAIERIRKWITFALGNDRLNKVCSRGSASRTISSVRPSTSSIMHECRISSPMPCSLHISSGPSTRPPVQRG